jgi:hypothetical protein
MSCCDLKVLELEGVEEPCSKCKKRLRKHRYYVKHKEECLAKSKNHRLANKEHVKQRDKKYHEEHREERRKQQAEYYAKNKEKIQAHRKEYRTEHPEKIREQAMKRLHNDPEYRISLALRQRVRRSVGTGSYYEDLVGCKKDFLLAWFTFNFEIDCQFEMTFDNFGDVWQIDHVLPVSKFDLLEEDQVKKCFNWKNTCPLPKKMNLLKSNKIVNSLVLRQGVRVKLFLEQQGLTTADQS